LPSLAVFGPLDPQAARAPANITTAPNLNAPRANRMLYRSKSPAPRAADILSGASTSWQEKVQR